MLLIQAVLSKFIRDIYLLGAQIDAGRLCGGAVVVDHNRAGTAVHCHRSGRGISTSDLRHTSTTCARRGTVLGQPEEKEISPEGGIEELRPFRAAGACRGSWNRRKRLLDRSNRFQGMTYEPEGVLPRRGIGGAGSAKMDQSSRSIIVVIVVESGLMKSDRGTSGSGGTPADPGCRQHGQTTRIDLLKNSGRTVIGGDHEGCAVGDIENRRSHDTLAEACSNRNG